MYIAGNHKFYPTDFDKINFVLSILNNNKAAAWNKQFVKEQPNLENLNLGTWDDFKKNIEEAFSPYDMPGEAREKLKRLQKEGKTPMNEHISMFKTLVTQAKIEKDEEAVMNNNRWTRTRIILLNPGHPRSNPLLDPPVEWQCITRFYSTLCLVIPFDSFPFPNTASFHDSYYFMTPILTRTTKPLTLDTAL